MQLEERWRANAAEKQALAMELQSIETRLASMETVACPTCGKPLASD
jgi:4-hydroxy-3-methylbut-2-en-1-yl diphosphate synthase IspG/GcpE